MITRIIFSALIAAVISLSSCSGNASQNTNNQPADTDSSQTQIYTVDELLEVIDTTFVGKKINIRGTVTHTCKHSGKRCFITGKGETTLRVEAKGNIGGFNKELIGSDIKVNGVIRETRMSPEQVEKIIKSNVIEDATGSLETCTSELNNVRSILKHGNNVTTDTYYSIVFIDGLSYELCE